MGFETQIYDKIHCNKYTISKGILFGIILNNYNRLLVVIASDSVAIATYADQ